MIEPEIASMLEDLRRVNLRCPGCVKATVLSLRKKDKLTLEQRDRIRAAHAALDLHAIPSVTSAKPVENPHVE